MDWLAAALVVAVIAAALTPLCTMPDCQDIGVGSCSDYAPACDDCPKGVVMKHTPDDSVQVAAPAQAVLVAVADVSRSPEPLVAEPAPHVPDATASPPPLDPLGVQLTI